MTILGRGGVFRSHDGCLRSKDGKALVGAAWVGKKWVEQIGWQDNNQAIQCIQLPVTLCHEHDKLFMLV